MTLTYEQLLESFPILEKNLLTQPQVRSCSIQQSVLTENSCEIADPPLAYIFILCNLKQYVLGKFMPITIHIWNDGTIQMEDHPNIHNVVEDWIESLINPV